MQKSSNDGRKKMKKSNAPKSVSILLQMKHTHTRKQQNEGDLDREFTRHI